MYRLPPGQPPTLLRPARLSTHFDSPSTKCDVRSTTLVHRFEPIFRLRPATMLHRRVRDRTASLSGVSCSVGDNPMNLALAHHQHELEHLCRTFNVRRLELFGSAASGRDCPDTSDLDFLVEFGPLPPGAYADTYF